MDNSAIRGVLLSGPSPGGLDMEPPFHRHQQHLFSNTPPARPHHAQAISSLPGVDTECPSSVAPRGFALNYTKGKGPGIAASVANNTSDEEEPSFGEDGSETQVNRVKGKKGSPWQRVKWTDSMVRLLIAVVACVEEDGGPENAEGPKRKFGVLQKKGKWKTISKIMMEKGCSVSPQQCEDKFNDLNKRYKRLNEILGKGTSCRVVENPTLLDSMTRLSHKVKDDVRKILSSKHLFYKEMCAYHNGQRIPSGQELELHGCAMPMSSCSKEANGFDEHEEIEDDDYIDNEVRGDGDARVSDFGKRESANEQENHLWSQAGGLDCLGAEIGRMLRDTSTSPCEQIEWIRARTLQLEEQRVSFQTQAFELEKRRFKWQRFCGKKDRELERLRLENERMKLENQRMALEVKQREMEMNLKRSQGPVCTVAVGLDTLQARDQIDRGRIQ